MTDAYFRTFNTLYPVLDQLTFRAKTLEHLIASGFAYSNASSVLALLVLALGELALEGVAGNAISTTSGMSSGVRGGTASHPPGLELCREARVS